MPASSRRTKQDHLAIKTGKLQPEIHARSIFSSPDVKQAPSACCLWLVNQFDSG
jgi:hypothetical protein